MAVYEDSLEKYQIINGITLKDEQLEAIDFALRKQNCILNLQPGTGKTLASLVASYKILSKVPNTICFIICPKAANTAFKKEFKTMGLSYSIITTEEKVINNKGRYFIFNYSNLDSMEKLLINLTDRGVRVFAVLDEIHVLGNTKSNLTERMVSLRDKFDCVIGLTGTPLLNNIMGLYAVVNYVKPYYLGTQNQFLNKWVQVKTRNIRVAGGRTRRIQDYVGYNNIEGLRRTLEKIIITRGKDYPIRFFYKECVLTEEEKTYYEKAAEGLIQDTESEKVMSARLWDLQKVTDGSNYMEKDKTYSKMKLLIENIKEIMQRGEGVLVYTETEDTYTAIGNLIKKYRGYLGYRELMYITGKTKYQDRVKCERKLGKKDIVIVTKAGNKSINLQAVNNVIFYNLPFALGDYIQMVGRVARTDSEYEFMNVYMLEVKDTIDTYKRMLLQSNMTLVQEIFGKSSSLPYYGDIDKDVMKKYRQFFKNKFLWCRVG